VKAFLVSTLVVGLAEIGDKTQILSLILAARFQRPIPILRGILGATLANHAAAGIAGVLFGSLISGDWMRWLLGLSFVGVAVWALFPDSYEESPQRIGRFGAFTATLVTFFLQRSATRRRSRRSASRRGLGNYTRSCSARRSACCSPIFPSCLSVTASPDRCPSKRSGSSLRVFSRCSAS